MDTEVPAGAAVFPLVPAELGVQPLLLAVLHAVVFLHGSTEAIVHPAAAEEALQYVACYLQRLEGEPLRRVREDLACLVTYARQEGWPKRDVRFLKDLLDNFGVRPESEQS